MTEATPLHVWSTTDLTPSDSAGALTVTAVSVFAVTVAADPPIVTLVVFVRFVPVMTTDVLPVVGPPAGEMLVMVGCPM